MGLGSRGRDRRWLLVGCLAGFAACGGSPSSTEDPAAKEAEPIRCEDLRDLDLPDTTITVVETVAAGAFVLPEPPTLIYGESPPTYDHLPAFCRVGATIFPVPDSEIRFEVWMPARGWNGKFVGTGNGGMSGEIWYWDLSEPLARGYAVANTDTGHRGDVSDMSFAIGHPEKLIDNAWRGVHEMTVKSKAVVAAHYGRPPQFSYWTGCSTGGRQGLVEAQRFPSDYDAISAGAPANHWIPLMVRNVQAQLVMADPAGALAPTKLRLLTEAALAACDGIDDVIDHVVEQPSACSWDPALLQCEGTDSAECLTAREVKAAQQIYGGVVSSQNGSQLYPGPEAGSESQWLAFQPGSFPIGENYFRDLVARDPNWDLSAFDADTDIARARALETAGFAATDPDLTDFVARDGKLLLWHGWTDGLIPAEASIWYYEDVRATMGAEADNSVRLFMAPGVNHCVGGEGPFLFDHLAILEEWVERGSAPARIIASRPLEDGSLRTRPLCPYPQVAQYTGDGSTDDAANFECRAPNDT